VLLLSNLLVLLLLPLVLEMLLCSQTGSSATADMATNDTLVSIQTIAPQVTRRSDRASGTADKDP
jgi:hypothetical protein